MIIKKNCFKRILFLALPLFMLQSLSACNSAKVTSADSIPHVTKEYNGFRLVISDIKVKKKKSKYTQLEYSLINTGREGIYHRKNGSGGTQPPIYFEFDHTLESSGLQANKEDLIRQALQEDIIIRTGQSLKKRSMKLRFSSGNTSSKEENTFTISVGKEDDSSDGKNYIDRTFCPDLRIDTLVVIKQSKKWATIQYTISNIGKGPASLKGETSKEEDNLALKAYLNRTAKLSKGAIPIGGDFITNKDLLEQGESYTGTIKLEMTKKTKFSSVLILELDPYQSVRECDETNNRGDVSLAND